MMRILLPAVLLLSALLAACASDKDALTAKDIPQSGALKVHPGLLGAPVAPQAPAKTDAVRRQRSNRAPANQAVARQKTATLALSRKAAEKAAPRGHFRALKRTGAGIWPSGRWRGIVHRVAADSEHDLVRKRNRGRHVRQGRDRRNQRRMLVGAEACLPPQ